MILPLPTHLQARSNSPSAFLVCRVRDLLDSEAGGDALSSCSFTSCRRDSRRRCCRLTTLDRVHGRRSFWRELTKKLRRLLVEQRCLQRWINSEVHVLHCSPSSRRPSSCGNCKICPSRGFLPKKSKVLKIKMA